VDPRNFKNPVKDDILTAVVGPLSNFLVASGAVGILFLIAKTSATGHGLVQTMPLSYRLGVAGLGTTSWLAPTTVFLYELMLINVILGVFNLIPVSPLDGSHVLRHFLPEAVRRIYDAAGVFGLLALVYLGGNLLARLISPFLGFFDRILTRF
jgi:Zn-dependent protease